MILADMDEEDSVGTWSKDGCFVDGNKFQVGGVPGGRMSLSLSPDLRGPSHVRYDLHGEPSECLVGHVAVADGSSASALPVVLEVLVDEVLKWTSEPMQVAGSKRFFRVFMENNASLELRARIADGHTLPANADAEYVAVELVEVALLMLNTPCSLCNCLCFLVLCVVLLCRLLTHPPAPPSLDLLCCFPG